MSWNQYLNPSLSNLKWTENDTKLLIDLHSTHGSKWKEITSYFPFRTDNGIKNQFFSIIRKSLRKICKISGIDMTSNDINEIKPKILSEFLGTSITPDEESFTQNTSNSCGGMKDLIMKFAFTKSSEITSEFSQKNKYFIKRAFESLREMK